MERDGVCSTNNVEIVRDRQMYSKKKANPVTYCGRIFFLSWFVYFLPLNNSKRSSHNTCPSRLKNTVTPVRVHTAINPACMIGSQSLMVQSQQCEFHKLGTIKINIYSEK